MTFSPIPVILAPGDVDKGPNPPPSWPIFAFNINNQSNCWLTYKGECIAIPGQQTVYAVHAGDNSPVFTLTATAPIGMGSNQTNPNGTCYVKLLADPEPYSPGVIAGPVAVNQNAKLVLTLTARALVAAVQSIKVEPTTQTLILAMPPTNGDNLVLRVTGDQSGIRYFPDQAVILDTTNGSIVYVPMLPTLDSSVTIRATNLLVPGATSVLDVLASPWPLAIVAGSGNPSVLPVKVEPVDATSTDLFGNATFPSDSPTNSKSGRVQTLPYVANASTLQWDRQRGSVAADAQAATGLLADQPMLYNGATWDLLREVAAADAQAATGILGVANQLFNGTNWDRQRNNITSTLLASAARTATTNAATQTNFNGRGALFYLNITAVPAVPGTGGLTLQILALDPVTSQGFGLLPAAVKVTTVGQKLYVLYPGSGTTLIGNAVEESQYPLPRTYLPSVSHADAQSYTYSLGQAVIL